MAVFPQLGTGALSQFPVTKHRHLRTVLNRAMDGSAIKLADPAAEITEWQLHFSSLSDAELAALQQFFESCEGKLNDFTFLDPTANLLAWSDKLDHAEWSKDPLLSISGGVADPNGGTNAWHLSNSGAAGQGVSQTLSAPAGYVYCLSVYGRSTEPTTVTLLLGAKRADRVLGTDWSRVVLAGSGNPADQSILFGVELPAGTAVDVYGFQAEPQAAPSGYKPSTSSGVYENARFRDDEFSLTSTDVNRHSAIVNIIHASHL